MEKEFPQKAWLEKAQPSRQSFRSHQKWKKVQKYCRVHQKRRRQKSKGTTGTRRFLPGSQLVFWSKQLDEALFGELYVVMLRTCLGNAERELGVCECVCKHTRQTVDFIRFWIWITNSTNSFLGFITIIITRHGSLKVKVSMFMRMVGKGKLS